jgi:hypothetical protein
MCSFIHTTYDNTKIDNEHDKKFEGDRVIGKPKKLNRKGRQGRKVIEGWFPCSPLPSPSLRPCGELGSGYRETKSLPRMNADFRGSGKAKPTTETLSVQDRVIARDRVIGKPKKLNGKGRQGRKVIEGWFPCSPLPSRSLRPCGELGSGDRETKSLPRRRGDAEDIRVRCAPAAGWVIGGGTAAVRASAFWD